MSLWTGLIRATVQWLRGRWELIQPRLDDWRARITARTKDAAGEVATTWATARTRHVQRMRTDAGYARALTEATSAVVKTVIPRPHVAAAVVVLITTLLVPGSTGDRTTDRYAGHLIGEGSDEDDADPFDTIRSWPHRPGSLPAWDRSSTE